ncbi:MAG TPA: 3-oxoacyl-ACP reductase [Citreicella sp.]|jgi:NAD(P)-dependent dehydrogenase (short-subunit alcohol dehydrogenase family)|nr:3-oxoacyl-ACP reductase [Citreicella sp.]
MTPRHVVIAGGSRGIGAACAARFAAAGDRVSVLSRSEGIRVDLREAGAVAAALQQAEAAQGPTDVLVCTAGAARQAPTSALDAAALREGMEAKYFPYANIIMAALPGMAARGRGVIVPVIGMGGKVASPTHLPGGAANAALMLLTSGLGHAYAASGIRVVGVNPGPVATARFDQLLAARAAQDGLSPEAARNAVTAVLPAGAVPTPEQLAEIVHFLAGDGAVMLNGTVIAADGGAVPVI